MENDKIFADPTWAIVQLFGRKVIAGKISEVTIAGGDMLRVDVPEINGQAAFTNFYGHAAIYGITPTDEESGMHAVEHFRTRPVDKWTVPDRTALPPGFGDEEEIGF